MKVGDLKIGMMLRPSINKWIQLRSGFKIEERLLDIYGPGIEINVERQNTKPHKTFMTSRIVARPDFLNNDTFELGVYMGYEKSDYWLDGVRKHHLILVGGNLTRINGYEFRYIETVDEDDSSES